MHILGEFLHGTSSSKRLCYILADSDPSHLLIIEALLSSFCSGIGGVWVVEAADLG